MLGENIIAQRKRLGLSQQALAEELETTVQALLLLLGYAATVDVGSMQESTAIEQSVVQLTE